MEKEQVLQTIIDSGVVAVIRMDDPAKLLKVADAIYKGGVSCLEITMTTPGAIEIISEVSKNMKNTLIGAGTVLDPETCRAAILAGAKFIVGPAVNPEVIKMCQRYSTIVAPGAFTPTEILTAWEAGADIVKVFPATALGPKYFKDVHGPLPQIRMMPTGGVNIDNSAEFIKMGACCVAIGTALLDKKAIAEENFDVLTEKAKKLVNSIKAVR